MGLFDIFKKKRTFSHAAKKETSDVGTEQKNAFEETRECSNMPNPDNSKGLNTDSIFKDTSAGKVTENNGWTASGGEQLCDPVAMPVEKIKENRTPKVSSYTIRLDGFNEEIVRANVFKNYTTGSVCYFLHCAKYPNNLYEKLMTLIEKNYHIELFSFPLHEDYWNYWDPNAEASMYKCNFKLNDCELELYEDCEDDSVFLKKEDGSDDGATDKLVAHLLQELMVDTTDIAKQTTQKSSEEKHNQETKNEIVQENADRRKESENEGQRHFLFSFIRPLDPSGLPFLEICVSIAIADGTPYLQSFFCSSPSFPPAPMPLNTKPISFEELHELTLCELANIKREEKEWENKNRADLANRYGKIAQKLEKIVGTKESEWEELLNL